MDPEIVEEQVGVEVESTPESQEEAFLRGGDAEEFGDWGISEEAEQEVVEQVSQEVESEEVEVNEETKNRIDELIAKNESEGLTEEEISELKELGGVDIEEGEPTEEVETPAEEWTAPYVDRLKGYFPEGNFKDQESVNEALESVMDALDNYREKDRMLTEAMDKNPEAKDFLEALMEGKSAIQAFVAAGLDPNDAIPKPGEDGYEEYIISKREKQNFQKQRDENLLKSGQVVKNFFDQNNVEVGTRKEIANELNQIVTDIANGNITERLAHHLLRGINYDKDVQKAQKEGEIRGANRKISLKKKQLVVVGDGIPRPNVTQGQSLISKQKVQYDNKNTQNFIENFG